MAEDRAALAAQLVLDGLEERGEASTLRLLADAYARLAEQALLDTAVVELYDRFKAAACATWPSTDC
jgi:hypothetical protein